MLNNNLGIINIPYIECLHRYLTCFKIMFYIWLLLIGKSVGKCTSHMDPMGIQVYQHE